MRNELKRLFEDKQRILQSFKETYLKMKIRNIGIILTVLCAFTSAAAQVANLKEAMELKDALVANFNRENFKAIHAMVADNSKADFPEAGFTNFLKNQFSQKGKITASELIEDFGEVKYFRLDFEKKVSLQLSLGVKSATEFYSFGLSGIRPKREKPPLSNNPLKSPMDLIVDKAAQNYLRDLRTVGLSIGVVKDGKFYTYNYGETEKSNGQLPTEDSFYEIGSITKTFTGILLAQAVLDKKVKLDDDIRKYLDGSFLNLEFQGQPITIKDLSTHTSGIPSAPDSVDKSDSGDPWANFSREQLLEELHRVKLERKPGEQAAYSNSAVGLLGNILEKVYGLSFEKLVEKFINKPAKMKETKIDLSEAETKRFVRGHNKSKVVPPWNLPGVKGAGALRSTTNEMLKYAQWNILAKSKAPQMAQRLQWQSPATTFRMGLGWILSTTPSGFQKVSHGGGTGGYRTYCTIYPQLKLGITVMSNNSDIDPNLVVDEIYMQIAKSDK